MRFKHEIDLTYLKIYPINWLLTLLFQCLRWKLKVERTSTLNLEALWFSGAWSRRLSFSPNLFNGKYLKEVNQGKKSFGLSLDKGELNSGLLLADGMDKHRKQLSSTSSRLITHFLSGLGPLITMLCLLTVHSS